MFSVSFTAIAKERILNFDSKITVQTDGSLTVKETIYVRGEQQAIKRRIYRDFPIRYRNKSGIWQRVNFKVLTVKRDGQDEPYFSESLGDYRRFYIGEKNVRRQM